MSNSSKIKQYNRALRKGASTRHVFRKESQWIVKKVNSHRASTIEKTQGSAVQKAQKMARRDNTRVVIHGRDGKIRKVL